MSGIAEDGPHPEVGAQRASKEGQTLLYRPILRDASLRDTPQDEGRREPASEADAALREAAWAAASTVVDPEIPVLTIADLGILRAIEVKNGTVEVAITPTYSGCPAMNMIAVEVELALRKAGIPAPKVVTVLSPAWTTDWMSADGRQKLLDYGIVPPPASGRRGLFGADRVACPHCGSTETLVISEFGSTSCKALWRCAACREPFDVFKCH